MGDYVKLEDAKDLAKTGRLVSNGSYESVCKALESLPTIDIVECKDCVHCADDWNGNEPQFTCELGLCTESIYPNDFCSVGERIEE